MFTLHRYPGIKPAILLLIIAVGLLITGGCGKKTSTARSPEKPAAIVYTDAELAEDFVVTMLRGSNVTKIEDGVNLGIPPYDFFFTVNNREKSPKQVLLKSSPPLDLKILRDDIEMFRYSSIQNPREKQKAVEVTPRGKKSWELKWNGRMGDGSYPPDGGYTLTFTLQSQPGFEFTAVDVQLIFPSEREDNTGQPEDEQDNTDPPPVIIPGIPGSGRAGG